MPNNFGVGLEAIQDRPLDARREAGHDAGDRFQSANFSHSNVGNKQTVCKKKT